MSIFNRDFEKAISSNDASTIRGRMGVEKGNKFIQDMHNKVYDGHHCGYDRPSSSERFRNYDED